VVALPLVSVVAAAGVEQCCSYCRCKAMLLVATIKSYVRAGCSVCRCVMQSGN
jgi:hypothetical protein